MSGRFALAVLFAAAFAVCACGKYGPPERTVTPESKETTEEIYPEPAFPEETVAPQPGVPEESVSPEPDFEEADPDEESEP